MNNNTNSSMIAGQQILNQNLNSEEINEYDNIIKKIEKLNIKTIKQTKGKVNMKNIIEIIKQLEQFEKKNYKREEIINIKEELIKFKKEISFPLKRLLEKNSQFINAMKEGSWILIDGIEKGSSQIAEKILGLCENNRVLDLFEYGENYHFDENSKDKNKKIHEDFRLFITFNPDIKTEKTNIQMLLDKCIIFSLAVFDANQKFSLDICLMKF